MDELKGVQTTGGFFTKEDANLVINNICSVFGCKKEDVCNLIPVQSGLTNIVLSFELFGGKYVYRHPGLGSDELVERGRETIMQKIVDEIGVDKTLVAMDVENGWRIGRFIEHRPFDYHNLNDMVRAVLLFRKLHDAPCKVRWNFDVIKKAEEIKSRIPPEKYGNFPNFKEITESVYKLNELTKLDGIKKGNIHGDARDDNFLINDEMIYLIDWEYGGYGDPGFDIGSYICGGYHSEEEIEQILYCYYRKKPTKEQRRHFYAYIAITAWFYLHWTMLKQSKGQVVGEIKDRWYQYANNYHLKALKMYTEK